MLWVAGILLFIIIAFIIWFSIPYSPLKSDFSKRRDNMLSAQQSSGQVFTMEDISALPSPLQNYFIKCGYIGKPKMQNIKMIHNDVDFILDSKKLKIKCSQFNVGEKPERIALINAKLLGIPFEGLDSYQNGVGSMKGMFAKSIVVFNQTGKEMNQSSLVNCLAESLLVPSITLKDFMKWEAIDKNHVKGTITYYGLSASGIFTFDSNGFFTNFITDDRVYVDTNGNAKKIKWSAICGDYREVSGVMQPKILKGIWHMPECDLVYFNGHDTLIEYN